MNNLYSKFCSAAILVGTFIFLSGCLFLLLQSYRLEAGRIIEGERVRFEKMEGPHVCER